MNSRKFLLDKMKEDGKGNVYVKINNNGIQFFPITEKDEVVLVPKYIIDKFILGELSYNTITKKFIKKNNFVEEKKLIKQLKQKLSETDYKAIKYAEGMLSYDEYLPIKNERQNCREEIRKLEIKIGL